MVFETKNLVCTRSYRLHITGANIQISRAREERNVDGKKDRVDGNKDRNMGGKISVICENSQQNINNLQSLHEVR